MNPIAKAALIGGISCVVLSTIAFAALSPSPKKDGGITIFSDRLSIANPPDGSASPQPSGSAQPTPTPCRPSPLAIKPVAMVWSIAPAAAAGLDCEVIDVSPNKTEAPRGPISLFKLTSEAFSNKGNIPDKYSCAEDHSAGNDISPPLSWGAGKHDAKSYAITLIDTTNGGKHWVIFDIPASTTSLAEGLGSGFAVPKLSPVKQKAMSSGKKSLQFFGPCPGGSKHLYQFKLYVLKVATLPGVTASSSVGQIESAILANDIAESTLDGYSDAAA